MSTRCRIGIQNKNGTITSIYCHFDGYIDWVGKILVDNYKDEGKVKQLMSLGDISSLGTEPIANPRAWEMPTPTFNKSWDEQWKEINPEDRCNTYASRGDDCPAETSKNATEYRQLSRDCNGEYTYLFKDNIWYVLNGSGMSEVQRILKCNKSKISG